MVYSVPMEEDGANEYADASTILDAFNTAGEANYADYADADQLAGGSVAANDYGGLRGARAVYIATNGNAERKLSKKQIKHSRWLFFFDCVGSTARTPT